MDFADKKDFMDDDCDIEGFPNTSTTSTSTGQAMSVETLKEFAISVQKMEEKSLPKGLSWFTKFMAKRGWHRQYEIIILDKAKFGNIYFKF